MPASLKWSPPKAADDSDEVVEEIEFKRAYVVGAVGPEDKD